MYFLLKSSLFRGHSFVFGGVKLTITSNRGQSYNLLSRFPCLPPLKTQQQVDHPESGPTPSTNLKKKNTTTELNSPPVLFGVFGEKFHLFGRIRKGSEFLESNKNRPSPESSKRKKRVGGWTTPSGEYWNWIISPNRDENKQIFETTTQQTTECLHPFRHGWKDVEICQACEVDTRHQGPDPTTDLWTDFCPKHFQISYPCCMKKTLLFVVVSLWSRQINNSKAVWFVRFVSSENPRCFGQLGKTESGPFPSPHNLPPKSLSWDIRGQGQCQADSHQDQGYLSWFSVQGQKRCKWTSTNTVFKYAPEMFEKKLFNLHLLRCGMILGAFLVANWKNATTGVKGLFKFLWFSFDCPFSQFSGWNLLTTRSKYTVNLAELQSDRLREASYDHCSTFSWWLPSPAPWFPYLSLENFNSSSSKRAWARKVGPAILTKEVDKNPRVFVRRTPADFPIKNGHELHWEKKCEVLKDVACSWVS